MSMCYSIPFDADADRHWPPYSGKGRRRFPRAWQPWTSDEERLLRELHGKMLSLKNISKILGRGLNGIRLRLQRLHLLPRSDKYCRFFDELKPKFSPLPADDGQILSGFSEEQISGIERTARSWEVNSAHLRLAVQSLDQIHWLVLSLHCRWSGQTAHTLEEIAELLGRSVPAVRQICFEAEETLRAALTYYARAAKCL